VTATPAHLDGFEPHRPLLIGLAYRLLGSLWDAEDAVQDAFVRWVSIDVADIREPRAFLITTVSRICLDMLKSSRRTREQYVGPWLPEPFVSDERGPEEASELRDSLAYATLHLLETLTPPERAVFVLREGFDVPYADVADVVATTEANCRQLLSRARRKVHGAAPARPATPDEQRFLLDRFLAAVESGNLSELSTLLSADVAAWNDGGGKVRAALRPVRGRAQVIAFLQGLLTRYGLGTTDRVQVNGQPGLRTGISGLRQIVAMDYADGRIHGIYVVLNPDKLRRVGGESVQSSNATLEANG
jgi:RNA polymerase sigma-70 factor (ECF subfamily)